MESLQQDVPLEGKTLEKRLDRLKADIPADQSQAPAGTSVAPLADSGQVTFAGSAPAAMAAGGSPVSPVEDLPVGLGQAEGQAAPAGTWNVSIDSHVAALAQGVNGVLLEIDTPAGGSVPVDVRLDYSAFKNLYGADWASRLKFVQFPDCYLSTPELEECQAYTELATENDTDSETATATVDPAATDGETPAGGVSTQLMTTAAQADPAGDKAAIGVVDSGDGAGGTFKASPLSASGKWAMTGSSGAFTWSYPIAVPIAPAGPTPKISLDYNSQTVDGRTAVTSPQASWIGEGWNYEPGHIERRYRTCQDDTKDMASGKPNNTGSANKTSDLCWVSYNAVMTLNGVTTELVRVDADTYRPAADDGTRVELRTGGTNGDDNGEYWVVTTVDGTAYHFGLNKVGTGHADTNSVSTVPVFGNHPGEPCHATAFADSRCGTGKQQAWRWGLDKVVDLHGNAMVVNWVQETNYYAVRKKFKTPERYSRYAYPASIEYGLRLSDLTKPAGVVEFATQQRCLQSAELCAATNFDKTDDPGAYRPWWDTPGNLNCKSGSDLCPPFPSFWTQRRLESITTKSERAGQTGLGKVDTYTLHQSFPAEWYDTSPGLWLNSVTRRGFAPGDSTGTLQSSDGVSFAQYQVGPRDPLQSRLRDRQLPNLVAGDPRRPGFTRPRIGVVSTEEGGDIEVKYTGGCAAEPATDKERANGTCFPVRWSPDGDEKKPAKAWFNKYVVASVVETDKVTTHGVPVYTQYTYKEPAWSQSDDEFTKPSLRTYSDWRGYREVTTVKGKKNNIKAGDPQAQSTSTTRYFLGVGGAVKDSAGKYTLAADDARPFAGQTAETLAYDRTAGRVVKRVLTFPWLKETASRAREGEDGTALEPLKAYRTGTARTDTVQTVGASWQSVRTTTDVDATYGLPTRSETSVVKPNGTGETLSDQRCTTYSYVHNTSVWLIGLASQTSTTATPCTGHATADPATELVSTTRSSYDGLAFGATPTKGLATATAVNDGAGNCCGIVTTSTYDALGRLRTVTKPGEGTTETRFTPADGGAVTASTSIQTVGGRELATTTTFDPGRALPLTVTDANGRVTRRQYDALGRLTAGWLPSRSAGNQSPSVKFGYQQAVATSSATKPAAVTTETLQDDGTYRRQIALYDGLGREVQSQEDAYGPGRIVVDTFYNDHGLAEEKTGKYLAKGSPTAALFEPRSDSVVPSKTRTRYDGMERPVQVSTYFGSTFKYATYTTYGDNYTKVDKPGSTVPVTDTYTDALGRVSSVRTYTDAAGTAKRVTSYGYDARGNRNKVTDPAGNVWTYLYDARGRLVSQTDPDSGTSAFAYDDAGRRVKSTQEATAKSIFTEYDVLGRTTAVREGAATTPPAQAALVKEFTYDTVAGALGKPATSTQYQGATAYLSRVTGYDTEYRPTGKQVVIPDTAATKGLSGTYTYGYGYTPTGKQLSVTLPAVGGLAAEKVVTRYDDEGLAESTSGQDWYTSDVSYSPFGEPLRVVSGGQPGRVWTTNFIDEHTGRLERSVTDRETTGPHRIADSRYAYDSAGLISSYARELTDAAGSTWDTQCFTYDRLGQLVNAWTSNIAVTGKGAGCKSASGTVWGPRTDGEPSGAGGADAADSAADTAGSPDATLTSTLAASAPASGTVASGGAAYWQTFTYDWLGNRATLVDHGATDTTSAYGYGRTVTGNGTGPTTVAQPHTLQRIVTTPTGPGSTYAYDSAGNTTDRDLPSGAQDLTWTQENRLATITVGGVKTTYVYDPEGNRLLESSSAGATLYLGETEVTADATGKVTKASRAYTQTGAPNVVRTALNGAATGHKLSVLLADSLGTAHTAVELTGAQTVTRRAAKPFGESRGTKPTAWPDRRGYLGVGIDDSVSGLTHLGAREYDQSTGRFVSVDPVMEMDDPLQINGYAYAGNSPLTRSDPTGLCPKDICDGYGQHDSASQQGGGGGNGSGTTGGATTSGSTDKPTQGRTGAEMAADKLRHDAAVQAMAALLRAIWAKNPDVHVQTEYHIPGAGTKKDGFADIVMFFNEDIYIWEVKSAKTAEEAGPAQLDRYVNTLNRIESKKTFGRTVHKGWELPQVATVDPIDPKLALVAQSTRSRPNTNRAGDEYKGIVGWWTRNQSRKAPPGMEPVPVWAPVPLQAWQPTPEQTKSIGVSAVLLTFLYVAGRIVADPIP